jgi:hypothetical protein
VKYFGLLVDAPRDFRPKDFRRAFFGYVFEVSLEKGR